mmetsp:Transcript_9081/g.14804  ORF Transcript_9081/g.14804 Transcript_9081/m.14804 type:complete len:198 (+) Transcript_9081:41-634(+)|eukprot:CAMPEP_0197023352 /NCGR_PEP_ID=MMETSP1384-20130603/4059_1 /TAXON_ID=29189 /ORGANISM="Ammonia sp." /LENGTH=197 /DNA_ID=CAMNT_0042451549 /DNA_START=21 /DNA_END=614 /DNA_ORIENTATION=+
MGLFDVLGLPPMISTGLESGMFALIGAVLCQSLFGEKGKGWDYMQFFSMITFSALIWCPPAFYWYPYLESLFPGNDDKMNIVYKVLLDQLVFSPLVLAAFWFHSTFLSTLDLNASVAAIPQNLLSSLVTNWVYWPFVQVINIAFVPVQHKVLVLNLASIPWNVYISYSVSKQQSAQTDGAQSDNAGKKKRKKRRKDL